MKTEYKVLIRDSAIFCGSFLLLFMLVFYVTFLSRGMWARGLQRSTQTVLDSTQSGNFVVGDFIQLKFPIAVSCAVFALTINDEFPSPSYAVIIRVTGFSGPVPLVFTSNARGTFFKGIAGIKNSQANIFDYGITDTMIVFWKQKIAKLLFSEEKGE